jgi:16S rRNA (adenine1518-N6/adenine1519-N6)-dimethyltransferase
LALLDRGARVTAVEIDPVLARQLPKTIAEHSHSEINRLTVLNRDILTLQAHEVEEQPTALVANLPYNVATPVISNLLLARYVPHSMIVTIQKELAERIIAPPSTKDYSALSVWIQSQCTAEIVRQLPPSVFWPAPKVSSAVLRIIVEPQRRARISDLSYFHQIIKALFLHRRKFLRANVVAAMKEHLDKVQVDKLLDDMGFAADTRTEQLDVETLIALADKIRAIAPDWKL